VAKSITDTKLALISDSMTRLLDGQEKLDGRLDKVDVTLAAQAAVLKEHVRRTQINEESLESLRNEVKPLVVHVAVVGAIGKVVAGIGILVGICVGIYQLLGWIS